MSYDARPPDTAMAGDYGQSGNAVEELDFELLFNDYPVLLEEPTRSHNISPRTGVAYPLDDGSEYDLKPYSSLADRRLSAYPIGRYEHTDSVGSKYYLDPQKSGEASALSPRIEITPSELMQSGGSFCNRISDNQTNSNSTSPQLLPVPVHDGGYREPICLSPASSNSSASFISETNFSPYTSPCVSPNNGPNDDLFYQFQPFHTHYSPRASPIMSPQARIPDDTFLGRHSPSPRPNSRSSSPGSKRRYPCPELYNSHQSTVSPRQSRSPSPQAPPPIQRMDVMNSLTDHPFVVPNKMCRNSPDPSPESSNKNMSYHLVIQNEEFLGPYEQEERKNSDPGSLLLLPPTWPKPLVPAMPYRCPEPEASWGDPLTLDTEVSWRIPAASLPSLEWPLASQVGSYELQIEVQPKPHHRAHYETEGSRGAVKATTGGHPVVQLHGYMKNEPLGLQIFIGTADERILKPHAFYQVHRITGKTVTTTSYERIIGNTKVLEIPLEPKTNMRATIDCAGILKLKNADIELRKGETDIGRKNTRVRLVFRIHIPDASGRIVSLQVASNPIECSQRSAHELPLVERQDIDSCPVYGGQQMILSGQNFTAESKVVFTEKTSDGQQIWEMDATVDKDKSQANMLFVEVPEYRNKLISTPVKVNFYVINGKRKRSQTQHFTYLPVPSIKTEPVDEYNHPIVGNNLHGGLTTVSPNYYAQHTMANESPSCLVTNLVSCQHVRSNLPSTESRYRQQNSSTVVYQGNKSLSPNQLGYHQPPLMSSQIPIPDAHRSVLVHVGSPIQSSAGLHSPVNPQQPPVIHYSPTNHQIRCGSHQDFQHIMCSDHFTTSPTRSSQPQVSQAQRISPGPYPTVIQQQSNSHRGPKNGPPITDQKEIQPSGVTVKQEQNLDQAYLDDVNEIIRKEFSGLPTRNQT
ncbi:nuclear factor of activated T-cells, cytoplasmic 2 isoform X2 [Pelobates fuscus]|uniref:nuclear factor of activated T-cells, cytoplasmic 2 isoform X2 n=1 Tax=Pelobates fuscus TaxID=191477 RepID=UPI002FE49C3A